MENTRTGRMNKREIWKTSHIIIELYQKSYIDIFLSPYIINVNIIILPSQTPYTYATLQLFLFPNV